MVTTKRGTTSPQSPTDGASFRSASHRLPKSEHGTLVGLRVHLFVGDLDGPWFQTEPDLGSRESDRQVMQAVLKVVSVSLRTSLSLPVKTETTR